MKILLAEPRGFCAGVEHALKIADEALQSGEKLYLLHEIVHNATVSAEIAARGAVLVNDIAEIPRGGRLLISAHGAAKSVFQQAVERNLQVIDATCPLVRRVQREAERLTSDGVCVLLFGNRHHREVVGILGQCGENAKIFVLESRLDAERFVPQPGMRYAVLSQTTWNMDEVAELTDLLKGKIPDLEVAGTVCNATSARQSAVRRLSDLCDTVFVIGSESSANTLRLKEIVEKSGKRVFLMENGDGVTAEMLAGVNVLGIAGGASAPECLVQGVLERVRALCGGGGAKHPIIVPPHADARRHPKG